MAFESLVGAVDQGTSSSRFLVSNRNSNEVHTFVVYHNTCNDVYVTSKTHPSLLWDLNPVPLVPVTATLPVFH